MKVCLHSVVEELAQWIDLQVREQDRMCHLLPRNLRLQVIIEYLADVGMIELTTPAGVTPTYLLDSDLAVKVDPIIAQERY